MHNTTHMSTTTLAKTLHYSVEAMSMDNNYYDHGGSSSSTSSVSEITEEEFSNSSHFYFNDAPPPPIPMSTISEENEDSTVYVAVGKSDTSMEALSWTLNNLVTPSSTFLYLIHVFPLIKHIPNPRKFSSSLFFSFLDHEFSFFFPFYFSVSMVDNICAICSHLSWVYYYL